MQGSGRPAVRRAGGADRAGQADPGRPAVRAGRAGRSSRSRPTAPCRPCSTVATPYEGGSDEARDSLTKLRTELVPADASARCRAPSTRSAACRRQRRRLRRTHLAEAAAGDRVRAAADVPDDGVTFRSVVVALTAIVLNLLCAGAAYGVLTAGLPEHLGRGLLDFQSNGAVVAWLPLFLFVVLFGLSMDYHVFVVSRIREAVLRGRADQAGRRRGHHRLGRRGDQRGGRDGRRCSRSSRR